MRPAYPPPPRQNALPLFLAGAAFILTGWLVADRMGLLDGGPRTEPRAITPRGDLADYEKDVIAIFEENAPSVVHITTVRQVRTYFGGLSAYPEGSGSGFLWDPDGTVITNFHVVEAALRSRSRDIVVAVDGKTYDAEVLSAAPAHDIAVVRVLGTPRNLRPIPIGTSADLRVGQFVVAIGNPFGLDRTLTTGVVSALDRTIKTRDGTILNGLIQIDADINPGNSGGPLLDSAGRLIGMNTAIYSPSGTSAGIGFSVPVDLINEIVPELLGGGRTQRYLGIDATDVDDRWLAGTGYRRGVAILNVEEGEGAHAAGLQPALLDERGAPQSMDIIVEVDGTPVASVSDLRKALRGRAKDAAVRLKILRTRYDERGSIEARPMEVPVTVR